MNLRRLRSIRRADVRPAACVNADQTKSVFGSENDWIARATSLLYAEERAHGGQCLTTKNRIVPGKRAAQIVRDCRQTGNHFICHKSAAGEIVHCRGVHDRCGSNTHRFAVAVGIPVREIDMDNRT